MSVPVPLDELAAALARRSNTAYLLTVGDEGRVHCVAAPLEWRDDELVVPAGATSARNAAARGHVVVLAPPAAGLASSSPPDSSPPDEAPTGIAAPGTTTTVATAMDAYSLIVDADVTGVSGEGGTGGAARAVRVRPSHAVFHRPAVAPDGTRQHDCVHVYDEAAPAG